MFVVTNFLTMTKIGIIGSDKYLFQLADLFRGIDGFELTGWFNDNYNDSAEISLPYNVIPYPTIEALFRYVDAIALNHEAIYDNLVIEKCLNTLSMFF